jgi:hypothetical protein
LNILEALRSMLSLFVIPKSNRSNHPDRYRPLLYWGENMRGIPTIGQPLSGVDHLRQSIRDILTARKGARVIGQV